MGLELGNRNPTVLGDFSRTVRDEPWHYIFKVRLWIKRDSVPANEVAAWLRHRYIDHPRGHRYRLTTYQAVDGQRYADQIFMETCNDVDLVHIKLRWGFSKIKQQRGNRMVKRRLRPDQRARLNSLLKKVTDAFYEAL